MKAEEWIKKVVWMSNVNWKIEVDRGRMVWELLARSSLEHAAEICLTGALLIESSVKMRGEDVCCRLATLVGGLVLGNLGWRKLGVRREKKKVLNVG